MEWLAFLAQPGFVVPWYLFGAAGAAWAAHDLSHTNTALKRAMKWAWPIIVFFFSVIGLALYFATARAPGVGRSADPEEKRRRHEAFERSMLRRVNGAVIHCVAGDGLGIMTAMVIARAMNFGFWQEFWFEYLVGFAFGLFIFQLASMRMMTPSLGRALWMAFRAEFFSMLTVMGGMGAVMAYVTPLVVGAQPKPSTAAFWGFGALGLLVGYVCTFPMNWMLVKVGWKHGMGRMENARPARTPLRRRTLFGAMAVLGALALALPAWLAVEREGRPLLLTGGAGSGATAARPQAPATAWAQTLAAARQHLLAGERAPAVEALDAAMRAATVLEAQDPDRFRAPLQAVSEARHDVQNGRWDDAIRTLDIAPPSVLPASALALQPGRLGACRGAKLLDAHGAVIGEVRRTEAGRIELALGGAHDVFGFWDHPRRTIWVPGVRVLGGPSRALGRSYALLLPVPRSD